MTAAPTGTYPAGNEGALPSPYVAAHVIASTLREVAVERTRQNAQWGQQDHPNGTGPDFAEVAQQAKDNCQEVFAAGLGTWRDILAEEVYEAFAEEDPGALRNELVQVAAVAVAWVEAIDRDAARHSPPGDSVAEMERDHYWQRNGEGTA